MNFRMIKNILGWILIFEAGFMLAPLLTAIIYSEEVFTSYLISMGICLLIGLLFIWRKPKDKTLYSREGFVIVSLSWIFLSIFGALPMFISREIPSYIDALFETVSGFTTTGASIVADVEELSHATLMWRSFTHWVGGMGVLVFVMAFVPLSGGNNMHIMKAESPGPSVSKLVPRVKTTALILYLIYIVLTLLEFLFLICGGMPIFDAINTSFATAGTGGFGVKRNSLLGYSSYIQIVTTVFMIIFSINFASYYLILLRRFKEAFTTEIRTFLGIVIAAITIITLNTVGLFDSVGEAIKHVSFSVASIISTTGFATVDFNLWPTLSRAVLVTVMFIGACAGSTGGGIKISRILIFIKSIAKELSLMLHPKQVRKVMIDKHPVEHEVVRATNVYMVCYVFTFIASVLLVSIEGFDLITTFTSVAATMNNIGPGLELVGPTGNFAFFNPFSKLVLIFDMLAGRLELFPMLLLFSHKTWKK
ncbi:MAG: TrkH family potassium uptake protein [Ruminococcaceae bacterium]|nr:TrkH family potassium uptake protein [Oscillospiraceae bacterium]